MSVSDTTPRPVEPTAVLPGTPVGFGEPQAPTTYGLPDHPVSTSEPTQPWYRRPGTIVPILIVVVLVVVRLVASTEAQHGAHWGAWLAVGALIVSLVIRFGMGGARRQARSPLRFILIPVAIVVGVIFAVTQHSSSNATPGVGSCWQSNSQGQVRTVSCSSSDASLVASAQVATESACAQGSGAVDAVEVSGGTYLCLKTR
jgi:hypothetical protein